MSDLSKTKNKVRASQHWNDSDDRIAPVIAITGGIGSGKSSCSTWMARYNIPVVDADIINACLLDTNRECLDEIIAAFGSEILDRFGKVKRSAMADIIFADDAQRRKLESILHPRIRHAVRVQIQEWRRMGAPYILLIIPLLPATNVDDWPVDWIVLIEASRDKRIERIMARSKKSKDKILRVLDAQCSDDEYRKIADEVITNDGSVEQFRERLDKLHTSVLHRFDSPPNQTQSHQ